MKKLILSLLFLVVASSARAQTATDVLAAANSATCERFGLALNCADAEVLTAYCTAKNIAPCVDSRVAEDKVYSTAAAYATAVLLPPKQKEVFAARRNQVVEKLVRIILSDPAKCATILAAAGLDTAVCK